MLPPFSGLATSQTVTQNQVNLGDVFSTQTLNVDTVSGSTSAATTATGNDVLATSDNIGIGVSSTQQSSGSIGAKTSLNMTNVDGVTTSPSSSTSIVTAATANAAEADSTGGGGVFGQFTQTSNAAPAASCTAQEDGTPLGCVKAENNFNAGSPAQTGAASVGAQAIANSVTANLTGGSSNFGVTQTNSATIDAENGSDVTGSAELGYTPGTAAFTSTAVANNFATNGNGAASATINASQTATGDFITAGQFSSTGDAQTIAGASAASANVMNIATSGGGDLDVTANQDNESGQTGAGYIGFIESNSVTSAFEFGTGQSMASGVGNAFDAENDGPTTDIALTQTNGNGMQASATFTGGNSDPSEPSYDASASASAIANQAQAINYGGGVMSASGGQTNSGGVSAVSSVDITGAARSVTSSATAIGNSATYTVSRGG